MVERISSLSLSLSLSLSSFSTIFKFSVIVLNLVTKIHYVIVYRTLLQLELLLEGTFVELFPWPSMPGSGATSMEQTALPL